MSNLELYRILMLAALFAAAIIVTNRANARRHQRRLARWKKEREARRQKSQKPDTQNQ